MKTEVAEKEFKQEVLKWKGEKGALIPLLQAAQNCFGYVAPRAIELIQSELKIPEADIFGVVTFYSQFRLTPLGRYVIKVCDGTACHVNGSTMLIDTLKEELKLDSKSDTTEDGLFTLVKVACLGCCSLSPVLMINEETYGKLNSQKVKQIIRQYRQSAEAK